MKSPTLATLALLISACSATPEAQPGLPSAVGDDAGVRCTEEQASSEIATIQNKYGTLEGTLSLPARCGAVPLVLILSGTGQTDRDANQVQASNTSDAYKMVAAALNAEANVAVFRFDDAGAGKSKKALPRSATEFTLEFEMNDAIAWIKMFRADPRISKVFVFGHSFGSLQGTMLAQVEKIDGLVSVEGPGRRCRELFYDQLVAQQLPQDAIDEIVAALEKLDRGELPAELKTAFGKQALPPGLLPYYRSYCRNDPAAELAKLTIPILITHGGVDTATQQADADALRAAKPEADYLYISDMAHMLKSATTSATSQERVLTDPTLPLAAGFVEGLSTFINKHR